MTMLETVDWTGKIFTGREVVQDTYPPVPPGTGTSAWRPRRWQVSV